MKSSPSNHSCPDQQSLSEFADNPVDQEIAVHLECCPSCRRQVDDYVRIQNILQQNSEPPPDLEDRILAGIHRESVPAVRSLSFRFPSWLRYAAAIAVTAAATVLWTRAYIDPASETTPAGQPPAVASAAAAAGASQSPRTAPAPESPAVLASAPSRSVAAGPLQAVSTESGAVGKNSGSRKYIPGDQVLHIWSVPDIIKARNILAGQLRGKSINWHKNEDILSAQFIISDQQLQKLVDSLYESGWELFSPLYPQPGAAGQTLLTGRKINYQIKIIPQS